jgi:hypothetical protein
MARHLRQGHVALKGQALAPHWRNDRARRKVCWDGVDLLSGLLKEFRDQSPMDWARMQTALAQALQALGEANAKRAIL